MDNNQDLELLRAAIAADPHFEMTVAVRNKLRNVITSGTRTRARGARAIMHSDHSADSDAVDLTTEPDTTPALSRMEQRIIDLERANTSISSSGRVRAFVGLDWEWRIDSSKN